MARRVIIETPYRGGGTSAEIQANTEFLRDCLHDAASRGDVPFASHGFFPLFLDEQVPAERDLGIRMGYEFWDWAECLVFYMDQGMSPGMKEALARAFEQGKPVEKRWLREPRPAVDLDLNAKPEVTPTPPRQDTRTDVSLQELMKRADTPRAAGLSAVSQALTDYTSGKKPAR